MSEKFWFKHDSNAKDDPKCILLVEQLGLEGYGIYWVLIELLREQKDYRYPIKLIPAIARRFNTSTEKVMTVIKGYSLFEIENDDFFFSAALQDRMLNYNEMLEKRRYAGIKSGEKRKKLEQTLNTCLTSVLQTNNTCSTNRVDKNRLDKNRIESINIERVNFEILKNSEFLFSIYTYLKGLKLDVSPDDVTGLLETYLTGMEADGDIYRSVNDYKSHFRNWIKIQVEKMKRVNGYGGLNERIDLFEVAK